MHSAMKEMSLQAASAVLGIIIAAVTGGTERPADQCTAPGINNDPACGDAAGLTDAEAEIRDGRDDCPWIGADLGLLDHWKVHEPPGRPAGIDRLNDFE